MKDKEDKEVDSEARPMKDETFGEYRWVSPQPGSDTPPNTNIKTYKLCKKQNSVST